MNNNFFEIRKKFYDHIYNRDIITQIVGAHNAIGSYLIEKNNFEGVWASGFEISASYGIPDANLLGLTEMLSEVKKIINGCSLPVLVDADTGFGDIFGIKRAIEEFESIGAAGVCIEDKVYPKTNSFIKGRQKMMDVDLFSQKIYTAKESKKDPYFLIVARIESLISGESIDNALFRANQYKEAGADVILIHSKSATSDEVFRFSNLWDLSLPLIIIPTTYPNIKISEIIENKVSAAIYANQGLRSSVLAMNQVLMRLRNGELRDINDHCASIEDIFEIQKMLDMISFEKKIKNQISMSIERL